MIAERPDPTDPRHFFRLLLQRLLETQHELSRCNKLSPSLSRQISTNSYTLSEIESWLKEVGEDWQVVPTRSSALTVVTFGAGSLPPCFPAGGPWKAPAASVPTEPPAGTPPAPSYQPSGSTRREWQRNSLGRISFLPQSSPAKPASTSDGSSSGCGKEGLDQ